MCVVHKQAQLLGNVVRAAQGVLHLRLLLQEAGIYLALVLLQLSVQGRLGHIGCNLQAITKALKLASWEQSGWLAQTSLQIV